MESVRLRVFSKENVAVIVEQKFLESDLAEIERVFLKSMENKSPILAKKSEYAIL